MTDELNALIDQTVSFVRLRRTSRRSSAAEARAALTIEDLLEDFRRNQGPVHPAPVASEKERVEVPA